MYVRLNFHRQRKTRTFHTLPAAQEYAGKAWAVFYGLEKRPYPPESLIREMTTRIPKSALQRVTGGSALIKLVDEYAAECVRSRFLAEAVRRRDKRRLVAKTQREALFATLGRKCASCGTTRDLTFDHITPWSFGGKTELSNLRVLCRPCNTRRSNRVEINSGHSPGTVTV